MKCAKCGFEWKSRVANPRACPKCKRYDPSVPLVKPRKKESPRTPEKEIFTPEPVPSYSPVVDPDDTLEGTSLLLTPREKELLRKKNASREKLFS